MLLCIRYRRSTTILLDAAHALLHGTATYVTSEELWLLCTMEPSTIGA